MVKKTADIKIRMPETLRQKIEDAASTGDVSMNAEMISRLERSFQLEDHLTQGLSFAYGPTIAGLALVMAKAFHRAGTEAALYQRASQNLSPDQAWTDDAYCYVEATQAVRLVLQLAQPHGKISLPDSMFGHRGVGERVATLLMGYIKDPDHAGEHHGWVVSIRKLLGPLVRRLPKPTWEAK